jgi:hypothetical protein
MGQYQRDLEDRVKQLEKMVNRAISKWEEPDERGGDVAMHGLCDDYEDYRKEYPEEEL